MRLTNSFLCRVVDDASRLVRQLLMHSFLLYVFFFHLVECISINLRIGIRNTAVWDLFACASQLLYHVVLTVLCLSMIDICFCVPKTGVRYISYYRMVMKWFYYFNLKFYFHLE